jgi:pyruvate dehydrogenase E2 component (dihydrolipoamide acetyltransferase)
MAQEIKLPELGEGLTGGDVLDVKVKSGDVVAKGQALLEIEAEKSTVEVPAPVAGRIAELLVQKGDHVEVGQAFCRIETDGAAKPAAPAAPPRRTEEPAKQPTAEASQDNGQRAKKPQPAPVAPAREAAPQPAAAPAKGKLVPAGPATRRLARELGIDLGHVSGTGPGGRITPEDVKDHVRQLAQRPAPTAGGADVTVPPLPDFTRWGPVERRPLDGVRRKTAEQMSLAWSVIPHVTQHDLADITDLDTFRRQHEGRGPKLTVTAFALKAAAIALRQFPQFNASLDLASSHLIVKDYVHIGVAVDTERGLLVPVIRDVDKKSINDLAEELADVADRARQKKVPIEELRGGTFTITNLGGIGGTAFTPIVNYPEVAILGLSRGRLQPVVKDGQVVPRLMLPLSLSYDHRVIDGADAARFTRRLADMLERPLVMLLDA